MQKYNVNYWFYLSDTIEVEADNEDSAIEKVKRMMESSEIVCDLNKKPMGDSGVQLA